MPIKTGPSLVLYNRCAQWLFCVLFIAVSSQVPYNMAQQYTQSRDVSNTYASQAQPAWQYSNYFNRAPQQNGPQQWQTRPRKGPLFIYVPPQNTSQIETQTKRNTEKILMSFIMSQFKFQPSSTVVRLTFVFPCRGKYFRYSGAHARFSNKFCQWNGSPGTRAPAEVLDFAQK